MAAFILGAEVLAPASKESASDLRIAVIVTDFEETETALKAAAKLSAGLHAAIDLVVAQVVPFPLPLREPPIPTSFTVGRLDNLAARLNVLPGIRVYLCRDPFETLIQVLGTYSVIMVGSRKRWLSSKPENLARALTRKGLHVVLAKRD